MAKSAPGFRVSRRAGAKPMQILGPAPEPVGEYVDRQIQLAVTGVERRFYSA